MLCQCTSARMSASICSSAYEHTSTCCAAERAHLAAPRQRGGRCRRARLSSAPSERRSSSGSSPDQHIAIQLEAQAAARSAPLRAASCRTPRSAPPPAPARRPRAAAAAPASAPSCPGPCRRPARRRSRCRPGASASGSRRAGSRAGRHPAPAADRTHAPAPAAQAAARLRQAASPSSTSRVAAGFPGQCRHARQTLPLLVRLRQRAQVGQLLAQRVAQGQEIALAERDEAAAAAARQLEQLAQAQHLAAVELELAFEFQPFALAAGRSLTAPSPTLRTRTGLPFGHSLTMSAPSRLSASTTASACSGSSSTHSCPSSSRKSERPEQLVEQRALVRQVAPSRQRQPLVHGGHALRGRCPAPGAGRSRRRARPAAPARSPVPCGVSSARSRWSAAHLVPGLGIAGHLEVRGQHAQRRIQLGARGDRHLPALRHQLVHAQLRGRQPHQPGAAVAVGQQHDVALPCALRAASAAAAARPAPRPCACAAVRTGSSRRKPM